MEINFNRKLQQQIVGNQHIHKPCIALLGLDLEEQSFLIQILESNGYEVVVTKNMTAFKNFLNRVTPNLVICEQQWDDSSAYDFVEWIHTDFDLQTIPVIMLSGLLDEEKQKSSGKSGIDDFFEKPLREYEILLRVQSLIRIQHLNEILMYKVQELEIAKADLEQLVITDALTGLHNYRFFKIMLTREILRAKRYKLPVSILMIDIDHFKQCNDTIGHISANTVLQELAQLFLNNVRSVDLVARYGGEEFGIVLPDTRKSDALIVAEKLRKITETSPLTSLCIQLTISIGISGFPEDGRDEEALVNCADQALLMAKRKGRNIIQSA